MPTRASAQHYNTTNTYTNPAYQPLSPSTFYPTSPTSATVYSRATTPGAGRSTYSGYVNTFGTQKPAHTRLPMKRVRFQRPRPSLSFASPDPNTPAMPTMPPGRVHTASTARSRSRRPVYAYAPQQQQQQQYQQQQQTQRPQAQQQQQYPFHMPAYGPPQPFAVPSSVANTNAPTRRRPHHAHAHTHTAAPSATAPVVPATRIPIPTTRTTRLARRPSKANMGYTRLGPSRRTGPSPSTGGGAATRSMSLCALVGRLADALLGNGPHTAARRAASAAAKLSGVGSGSRIGSGHKRNARRDAVWRAQLEDVVCRECARLLEYAQ